MTIRMKLGIAVITMMTLSVAATGLFSYISSSRAVLDMTKSTMLQINKDNASIIRTSIDKEKANVSILAKQKDILDFLSKSNSGGATSGDIQQSELNDRLLQISKDAGNYEHIFLVNRENSESILSFVDKKVLEDYKKLIEVSEMYNEDASIVNKIMSDFNVTSEQLNLAVGNIATAVNEVAITVNEGAKGVEDIAGKTTDIVDKAIEVVNVAEENEESVKKLHELVEKFIL